MTFDPTLIFQLLFYVLMLGTLIHAVVLGYHWFSFGAEPRVSFIGTSIFIAGDVIILTGLALIIFL